jgi:hypothetical protein
MQKPLSKIKVILSFSFFNAFLAVTALAGVGAEKVSIPLEVFQRKPKPTPPISGQLWVSATKPGFASGRAVLLLGMPTLAESIANAGFDVLSIEFRENGIKSVLEDIQSAVAYLKTEPRIAANRVSIVGNALGANGAALYASSTKQMSYIVDGLALLGAKENIKGADLFPSLDRLYGIPALLVAVNTDVVAKKTNRKGADHCKTLCQDTVVKSKTSDDLKKVILEFLKKPTTHGH